MKWLNILTTRLRALWRREAVLDDIDEELRSHLEMETQAYVQRGMRPEEARRTALGSFGNIGRIKDTAYDIRGGGMLETLWQDLRFGARMLRKQPGFALIAVITLALGIGANTAIFSVVNLLLFKPLPYPEPERLVVLARENPRAPQRPGQRVMQFWSYPVFTALREQNQSFESIVAYQTLTATMTVADQPEREQGEIVTASYFPLLGVRAALGRTLVPEEDREPDTHPVVVISHDIWMRRFGGDREVVGKTLHINKLPFTVIGVLRVGFRGESGSAQFWTPAMMAGKLLWPTALTSPGNSTFKVIARLKSDVRLERAQAELTTLVEVITRTLPYSKLAQSGKEVSKLIPLKETKIDPAVRRAFLILLGAVLCVLLITCANTANLLLARAVARQNEFAVRLALGAGRGRIIQQLLTESVLLAALGGSVGLLVAIWGIGWLTTAKPWNTVGFWSQYAQTFDYFSVKLDGPVLAFNFVLALATGVIFGLAPAQQAARLQITERLKAGAGSSTGGFGGLHRLRMRGTLVVAQIALSLVLLACAGLLIKSFTRLIAVKLGFSPEGVVTMNLGAGVQSSEFQRSLLERVRALPGVQAASLSDSTPLETTSGFMAEIEGGIKEETKMVRVGNNVVTPDYFKTYNISVLKGRGLTEQDHAGAPRVGVINRTLADRFWPGEESIGKRFKSPLRAKYEDAQPWIEVVGVVDDVKHGAIEEPTEPLLYHSAWQHTVTPDALSLRTTADTAAVVAAVRREVRALDKGAPIYRITTLSERAAQVTSRYRYSALLMGIFAAFALLLAGVGIYGVIGYSVTARTHEFGIRMALGAQPRQLFKLVIVDGAVLILAGLLFGLAAGLAATRVLRNQLYEVGTNDPLTFVTVALLLAGVALLACYIPARRATKVDPIVALKYE